MVRAGDRHLAVDVRRKSGAGSLYWLGLRDKSGAYLDGGKTYKLSVPLPVPAGLFWSVTVYDPETRSEVQTKQNKAALRSLFELKDTPSSGTVDLYFGPKAPAATRTLDPDHPGQGLVHLLRIYAPGAPPHGSWKPGISAGE